MGLRTSVAIVLLNTCEVNRQGVWFLQVITDEGFTNWIDH